MNAMGPAMTGLLGVGAGFLLALIAYVTVAQAFRQQLAGFDPTRGPDERARLERSWLLIRAILLADFVILGAVGYYAGRLLGS